MQGKKTLNLVVAGRTNVGKSALVARKLGLSFLKEHKETIPADFNSTEYVQSSQAYRLQIVDTGRQVRFRGLSFPFLNTAHGVLLVIDVTDRISLSSAEGFYKHRCQGSGLDNAAIHLVVNKVDIAEEDWALSEDEIEAFATNKLGIDADDIIYTSAKEPEHEKCSRNNDGAVVDIFENIAQSIIANLAQIEKDEKPMRHKHKKHGKRINQPRIKIQTKHNKPVDEDELKRIEKATTIDGCHTVYLYLIQKHGINRTPDATINLLKEKVKELYTELAEFTKGEDEQIKTILDHHKKTGSKALQKTGQIAGSALSLFNKNAKAWNEKRGPGRTYSVHRNDYETHIVNNGTTFVESKANSEDGDSSDFGSSYE